MLDGLSGDEQEKNLEGLSEEVTSSEILRAVTRKN